jgi:hypothetical protein
VVGAAGWQAARLNASRIVSSSQIRVFIMPPWLNILRNTGPLYLIPSINGFEALTDLLDGCLIANNEDEG